MKNKNMGFFLAETIVMIALVTSVMAFVFPNISKLYINFENKVKYYDQPEDIYYLMAYYKANAGGKDGIDERTRGETKHEIGEKKFGTLDKIVKDTDKTIYIADYMGNYNSGDDFNFNRYLKRLKKTTSDYSSYRIIGIFNDNGQERFASIKIENPNKNRNSNLGEKYDWKYEK